MPETKKIFCFTLILSFLVQYGVWNCQIMTIFDWYKIFAVCTYKISRSKDM